MESPDRGTTPDQGTAPEQETPPDQGNEASPRGIAGVRRFGTERLRLPDLDRPRPSTRILEPAGHVSRFGGRMVHWRQQSGQQAPVVLMAGCGLAMEFWREVVRGLEGRHIVAYDRPGMGGTRWPGHLPTLAEEVDTLHDLVTSLDAGPAILVAHSMAAFHAEAFARECPNLVEAIVYIDPSVEFMDSAPKPGALKPARLVAHLGDNHRVGKLGSLAWRMGSWTQSHRAYRRFGEGRLPSIYNHADSLAMATAESFAYPEQAWDLLKVRERLPYPSVPSIVLSASGGEARRHLAKQVELARLLDAEQVVVENSRHLMMLDRPDAILAAIGDASGDVGLAASAGVSA